MRGPGGDLGILTPYLDYLTINNERKRRLWTWEFILLFSLLEPVVNKFLWSLGWIVYYTL